MKVRRVATGHDAEGKAVVASDEAVDGITSDLIPGFEFHRLWGADETLTFPDDGSPPSQHTYFPPLGGFRVGLFTVPPESTMAPEDIDVEAAAKAVEESLPGLADHMEADDPAMHTTDTVDFEYVVSGRISLELDDGVEVDLVAGDTVVQNGTRHAWRNHSDEPATMVVCLIGARRA